MWTRKELKEKAKGRIKYNYWRTVLVSLIFLLVAGGFGAGSSVSSSLSRMTSSSNESTYDSYDDDEHIIDDDIYTYNHVGIIIAIIVGGSIMLIIFAIAFAIQCLLLNPLIVGCNRYFITNLSTDAELKEICYTYDRGYRNGVSVMFFRDLFTFLWTLLFIIPGIIKSYEYRMIPYLLAENPDMDRATAFSISKQMMTGNKWDTFVLDLSFIGWYILSAITCGILNVFFTSPYANLTSAALYVELRDKMNAVTQEQLIKN